MRKHLPTILLCILFLAGLGLLLYPSVSDYYNSLHQTQAVVDYSQLVSTLDEDRYADVLEQARAYNEKLAERGYTSFNLDEEELAEYESMLNVDSVMGYVEIPSIQCILPIYHGTSEAALAAGIGHIEGSSLPIGGESTHCVLSGHRGVPQAKLFTDLDKLVVGDVFMLRVLDETLTYEVDQIRIVEPDDIDDLAIVPGKDYCTLVTCTPYGINTQRLLVRGHRIENLADSDSVRVTADAMQIEPVLVAPFAAVPIFALMLLWVFRKPNKNKRKNTRKDDGKT
jgi:sortase A